jgi:hypothetical protein
VHTSIALICCSNDAARRDVVEKTWSRVLVEIIREGSLKIMGVQYLTLDVVEAEKVSGLGCEGETGLVAEDMAREEEEVKVRKRSSRRPRDVIKKASGKKSRERY